MEISKNTGNGYNEITERERQQAELKCMWEKTLSQYSHDTRLKRWCVNRVSVTAGVRLSYGCFILIISQLPLMSYPFRLKPVQKMEGMTNGMSSGAGQQQQQQTSGLSDISAQVQQYQQFLGKNTPRFGLDRPSLMNRFTK